jgi:dCMP deaminase
MERWDNYFLKMARTAGENSQCLSRKIGAIIVKDKSIISTGYNGPPRGVPTCDKRWGVDKALSFDLPMDKNGQCPRLAMGFKSGEGLEYCIAGHAERNAIVNTVREGGPSTKGATMYCDCGTPCTPCLVEIINSGIIEIVVTSLDLYDKTAEYLIKTSGIKVREYR